MLDERLVGTWTLVANEWLMPDGSVAFRPFGEAPLGQLIYTADGAVSAVLADSQRPDVRPHEGSSEERAVAYDRLLAYTGSWEVKGESVIHHVVVGSLPEDTGRDRVRTFTLADNHLVLTAPPRITAGVSQTHRITWRRRS